MKLVFMGSSSFCLPTLEELSFSNNDILSVYTQPPRKAGRGNKVLEVPVADLARKLGLDLRQPENFQREFEIDKLKALNPDVIVVVAYGLILPREVLTIPRIAPINIHASILPRWRGAAPLQRAIMNGDSTTGLSIMHMDHGLDTGPIYDVMVEPIHNTDTYTSLSIRLSKLAPEFLLNFLENKDNFSSPRIQKTDGILYAEKIKKSDTKIDWSKTAEEIDCHIRGLASKPGAWTSIEKERVKVFSSKVSNNFQSKTDVIPGTVSEILENGIEIICGKGRLIIDHLQRPGKKSLVFDELMRGFSIFPGQIWD